MRSRSPVSGESMTVMRMATSYEKRFNSDSLLKTKKSI